ncbi:hypothetical protein AURDEDRAFT_175736 [Auricularia subglabra TFB-10046 SS5]|uniref:Uncharacterized protein n=1 Tax=Auricularia subglabra (strain TFB-10046 / SS5) TaxID=717982 RepID=J0WSS1_AURST|nr:hypothetical protein AURDEDRAFT_175736 [Auricularia subglabra TFB-10046 SS5]
MTFIPATLGPFRPCAPSVYRLLVFTRILIVVTIVAALLPSPYPPAYGAECGGAYEGQLTPTRPVWLTCQPFPIPASARSCRKALRAQNSPFNSLSSRADIAIRPRSQDMNSSFLETHWLPDAPRTIFSAPLQSMLAHP